VAALTPGGAVAGRSIVPVVVAAGAAILVLAGLHAAASFVILVAYSGIITTLLVPLVEWLRGRGLPGWAGLLVALLVYLVVLVVAGGLLAVGLIGFLRDLPQYRDELEAFLAGLGFAPDGDSSAGSAADAVDGVVRSLASEALGVLSTIGYSVFIIGYVLYEAPSLPDRARWAFGQQTEFVDRTGALAERLRTYLVARALLGFVAAALDTVLLIVLGVPSAFLWGILSFLLSFVPNVGFILALIPPTVLALVVQGPLVALAVVAGYAIINIAIDYLVQPRFIGSEVDISPTVITVCLIFWTVILGGAGAILAIPLTLVVAAIADAFPDSRPLARMLGQRSGAPAL
jgi:predicted PurR-regulated permease PerM